MESLATSNSPTPMPDIILNLESTDIPSYALPKPDAGKRLILPTSARLSVTGEKLRIEMIVVDSESWGDQYYEAPTFEDENPPTVSLEIHKSKIQCLIVGGHTFHMRHPTAILKISDPGGIEESLTLTFSSSDSNNSQYAIKMLARELGAQLEVTVKDQQVPPDDEMPF
jgi:hypothetical protein